MINPFLGSRALALAALVAVSACAFSPTEGIHRSMSVKAGGADVIIAGPNGFCIDERTTDENRQGAFVFLSDCAVTTGARPTIARIPISAVLTASVSNSGLPGAENGVVAALENLQEFLKTPIGQISLGKSGNPATVSVLSLSHSDDAVYAFVEDTTVTTTTGESPRYWRAFIEVGGRLVALSATGYNRVDAEQKRIQQIIISFVAALHAANPS